MGEGDGQRGHHQRRGLHRDGGALRDALLQRRGQHGDHGGGLARRQGVERGYAHREHGAHVLQAERGGYAEAYDAEAELEGRGTRGLVT